MTAAPQPALDRATILAVAREVALLIRGSGVAAEDRMLTAAEVAARFNVERSWVYAHAEQLGVVRLGDGPRPRLRFDAAVVAQRLVAKPGRIPATRPFTPLKADVPLLLVKRPRPGRRLEAE